METGIDKCTVLQARKNVTARNGIQAQNGVTFFGHIIQLRAQNQKTNKNARKPRLISFNARLNYDPSINHMHTHEQL